MIYKKLFGLEISALGLGAMRLPTVNGNNKEIDKVATAEIVEYAISSGVNYFDTAYVYHGGTSEAVLCEILSKYPRDSYYLADKFPGFNTDYCEKLKDIFEEQLKRCRTEYFDFYLFHNVSDKSVEWYTDPKYGVMDYLWEQKQKGRIRHLGFSCHSSFDSFKRFLDMYGDKLEFCQLQVNYLDWNFQDVKSKISLLEERNIPVWVMEPVRGGRLCKLPISAELELKKMRSDETLPGWAFRFIQSIPSVGVTLSGMSNLKQLKENIKTFSEFKPADDRERKTLIGIADEMVQAGVLQCTGCSYCTDGCPVQLDIPSLISLYNDYLYTKDTESARKKLSLFEDDKLPSACIACKECEAVCPQGIKISEAFSKFTEEVKK